MDYKTTDDTIAAIESLLEKHCPGTYANAFKLAEFLIQAAKKIRDEANDDMSCRSD